MFCKNRYFNPVFWISVKMKYFNALFQYKYLNSPQYSYWLLKFPISCRHFQFRHESFNDAHGQKTLNWYGRIKTPNINSTLQKTSIMVDCVFFYFFLLVSLSIFWFFLWKFSWKNIFLWYLDFFVASTGFLQYFPSKYPINMYNWYYKKK